jgi:hypothetical protein
VLREVFYDAPAYSEVPSPWYQVDAKADGEPRNRPLELGGAGSDQYWRGTYRSLWLDPYQSPPGFGFLSLLAVAYNGGHSSDPSSIVGTQAYNMKGARFSCEVRAENLRLGKRVRLFFWIQIRDERANLGEGRYVNLSYLAKPLDRALGFTAPFERGKHQTITSDFVPFIVNFDAARLHDWIHMGSALNRLDTYENSTTHVPTTLDCFDRWDSNCGFIAAYGPSLPMVHDYPSGHLDFRKLKLEVDDTVNAV